MNILNLTGRDKELFTEDNTNRLVNIQESLLI
jgi:hypothetical protein